MASPGLWVEPHKGVEIGHFRTLIKELEALLPGIKAMKSPNEFDQLVIRLMEGWLAQVNSAYAYDAFIDFAFRWCKNDPRSQLKELQRILFPVNSKFPYLAFVPFAGCWTFRLTESEKEKACSGFNRAKELVKISIRHLHSPGPYCKWLCRKYFGDPGRTPDFVTEVWTIGELLSRFVRLKAATDDNHMMDVLCKGTEDRAGARAVGYVDSAGDAQIPHARLAKYSRCTYLTDRFFRPIEQHEQNDPLFSAQYHLKSGMTILHELTHHVLGTDDKKVNGKDAYGRLKCINLALQSQDYSMNNADSLALFAQDLALFDMGFSLKDHL